MWCWRRMLRISWFMKRSNINVLEEIQPKRRLLSHVQSQMMKYFGHIARRGGDSLEKVIMQGCVEGRRKPGRPRTRWIDQIKSMVGCPLHELYNLVQDHQRWCDVVAVASCQSWQDRTDRPIPMQLIHFDCVNGFLNSIKEIIWQTEATYRCPLSLHDLYKFYNLAKINTYDYQNFIYYPYN